MRSKSFKHNTKESENSQKDKLNHATIKTSRVKHHINTNKNIVENNCKMSDVTALNTWRFSPTYHANQHFGTKDECSSPHNL